MKIQVASKLLHLAAHVKADIQKKENLLARLAALKSGYEGHLKVTLGKVYRRLCMSRLDGGWAIQLQYWTCIRYTEVCLLSLKWPKIAV